MRILVVEDEEQLAQSICKGLEKFGYAADYLTHGDEAEERIGLHHIDYDLIILDLMLPQRNGFELCESIRKRGITIPILMLTARDVVDDKIRALENGVDDYLTKPFAFRELVARTRALLRRPTPSLPIRLRTGDLELDAGTRIVLREHNPIPLTTKEFSILEYLMRHPGKVINREELFCHIWDFNNDSFSNVIDVHIKNLRKKIDGGYDKRILETIRGVGYRISA
jgi:DNA-binding response OmpR family regulator